MSFWPISPEFIANLVAGQGEKMPKAKKDEGEAGKSPLKSPRKSPLKAKKPKDKNAVSFFGVLQSDSSWLC